MTFNEKLCQLIDARLARDPLFEPSEVAVNIDLDGGVTYCWARQPGPLKLRRFERLVRKARQDLVAQERRGAAAHGQGREFDLGSAASREAGAK